MECRIPLLSLVLSALLSLSSPEPTPQFYPPQYPGQPSYRNPQDSAYGGSQPWPQFLPNNFSHPNPNPVPNYLDPLTSQAADDMLKNDVPRQLYGVPPSPSSAYPQIYKLDNIIIIANPQQPQPQPCIPQRPPPQFPNPGGNTDDGMNRFGEEPTKCTWAIVACCSPDNVNVRYNCFELLGCPGFFFDNSPCDPKTVMAAANAALDYYRSAGNSSSNAPVDNRV